MNVTIAKKINVLITLIWHGCQKVRKCFCFSKRHLCTTIYHGIQDDTTGTRNAFRLVSKLCPVSKEVA